MANQKKLYQRLRNLEFEERDLRRRVSQSMGTTSAYATTDHCKELQKKHSMIQKDIIAVKEAIAKIRSHGDSASNGYQRTTYYPLGKKDFDGTWWLIGFLIFGVVVILLFI